MSDPPPHPAARTKAAMWSRRRSAVTAWRRQATWTVPVKASQATAPASTARPPVSLLTCCWFTVYICVRDLFPCHFDFNSWFFFIPLFWPSLSNILAPSASPPKTLNLDEVMESARDLFNLRLAHEVVMNRNFHLEPESLPQDRYTMKKIGGLHLFTLWSFFVEYQWT